MARIRSIKPAFFRHEQLQDLAARDGAEVMLVFAGLWTQCDSKGRFEWKPRQLKLDILPFLDFKMDAMLQALAAENFVTKYEVDGREYGEIPTFLSHQRLSGKEKEDGEHFPPNPNASPGSTGEASEKHPESQEGERELGRGIGRGKDTRRESGGEFASENAKKDVWKLICEIWGFNPKTRQEFKRIEALFRDFTAKSSGDLEAIRDTVRRYAKVLPAGAMCTPEAVLKHWDTCQAHKPVAKTAKAISPEERARIEKQEADEAAWKALPSEERQRQWQETVDAMRRAAGLK